MAYLEENIVLQYGKNARRNAYDGSFLIVSRISLPSYKNKKIDFIALKYSEII